MEIKYNRRKYDNSLLLELYKNILKPRMIEEKMLLLLRQGKVSKWFSGIGQEAISVGATMALKQNEFILPMHRNLGVFTSRNIPLNRLFAQFQGKMTGFTKGRDRSFHFGTHEYNIVGMISHLGPQLGVADGIALYHKINKEKNVCIVFSGDGGASEGDFHEAINTAAVWQLPVIFLIENNGYGLSTPSNEQFIFKNFIDKGPGYGIETELIDGNNILDVYHKISLIAESLREKPRPVLVECLTFRMRGHEEASGTKYVPQELFDIWQKKDPVSNYEEFLIKEKILNEESIKKIRLDIRLEIENGLEQAFSEKPIEPDIEREIQDVYAPFQFTETISNTPKKEMRLIDAIHNSLHHALKKHNNLILMGQDIAEYGGVFKATEGFVQEFGKDRIRNTPLCESAIVGAALGYSIKGGKAMVEMQFADFVSEAITQICNNLAKTHWRWGQNADVVIRMPTGAGVAAGPFHSQSNEAWFFKTSGLKIAYPSNPYDAKGLLLTAFEDPNPVIFFEHKALYRSISGNVPEEYYTIPFGKAITVKEGEKISIITYGMGIHWAIETATENNIDADIIDLRTLIPLDTETIFASVKKTGKVLILHEDSLTGGIGGELSALITEHCFEYLDAPVVRCASADTPIPFSPKLEENYLAKNTLLQKINTLLEY
jgi:2-oxoisovalerate dehydrogenase E1 component